MNKQDVMLQSRISDILLDFARMAQNDFTTSDLQGIAIIKAMEIIKIVKEKA